MKSEGVRPGSVTAVILSRESVILISDAFDRVLLNKGSGKYVIDFKNVMEKCI